MALMPWVAVLLIFPLTNYWAAPGAPFVMVATAIFGAVTLNAAIFHPSGRDMLRCVGAARMDRVILVLVALAAAPLLAYASTNIALQRTVINDHAAAGHYGFMAAFAINVIGVGLLASLRPDGWRLTVWVTGILPAVLGLASFVFPVDSSLSAMWSIAAIAWGVIYVAAAERAAGR